MTKRAFGELGAQVLHIFQEAKGRLTVKKVLEKLGSQDNYNTVMTVMNRLVKKGELSRERIGLQCHYWLGEESKQMTILERFKQKLFGMKTSAMVSYLIESAEDLTNEDVTQIEKMLAQAKERNLK